MTAAPHRSAPKPIVAADPGLAAVRVFPSIRAAGRAGFNRRDVWQVLAGRRIHHLGYWWTFLRATDANPYRVGGSHA